MDAGRMKAEVASSSLNAGMFRGSTVPDL